MSKSREKQLRYLLYLQEEIIKEAKKKSKEYRNELNQLEGGKQKTYKRRKNGNRKY